MGLGLYTIQSPADRAISTLKGASQSFAAMDKKGGSTTKSTRVNPEPQKTAGGALASAATGAAAGTVFGGVGAVVGGVAGLAMYYLG